MNSLQAHVWRSAERERTGDIEIVVCCGIEGFSVHAARAADILDSRFPLDKLGTGAGMTNGG